MSQNFLFFFNLGTTKAFQYIAMSKLAVFQILNVFFALKRSIFLGFFLDQIQNKHKYGNIGNKRLTLSKTIFILNENSVIAL